MGGVLSAPSRSSIDYEDESIWHAQHEILTAKLEFFRNWRIEDVEVVLDRFRARIDLGEDPNTIVPGGASWAGVAITTARRADSRVDYAAVQLEWYELFHAVLDADAQREQSIRLRRQWHVAARGYAMAKNDELGAARQTTPCSEDSGTDPPSSGHTDDEASDEEGEQAQIASGDEKMNATSEWTRNLGAQIAGDGDSRAALGYDPTVVSPIFFGYTLTTDADVDTARAKVTTLETEFERARKKRVLELQTAKKVMTAEEYDSVLKQWNTDEASITQAHESELAERKCKFAFLNREDAKKIQQTANAAKYAEKAEVSKIPRGAQLEALARGEVERLVGEIDKANEAVKLAQDELLAAQELRGKKGEARARQVVETSLILLEGRAATSEKELDVLLEQLQEAEFMLKRSQRIRSQEDLVLPLYEPLARSAAEGDFRAPFFSVLCGLAVTSNDTLWEKLTFIAHLFDVNDNKFMDKEEICTMLATLARVLDSLKLLRVKTSQEELESLVTRAFLEGNLDYRRGMTNYEVKSWMAGVVARSPKLSDIFGSSWTFGQMSTLMRCKMGMVHEFELGMISMVDLKHKVARKLIKHRPCLQKENIQATHDRALAMGDDDRLKPDYSRFMRTDKKTSFSHAITLRHGHLENYSHWRETVRTKAAIKIQNIFRGKLARQAAENIAKKHAFLCAREMALEDTRQRIAAEIWKKEAASGVGRLKWDAKVRMKQAKLRTAGETVDRQEVVEAIIEESVQAAQHGVAERFDEIARERGFHEDAVESSSEQAPSSDDEGDFLTLATASREASLRTKAACKQLATHLLSADVRHAAGQVWVKEVITDLGRPSTPRKEGKKNGAEEAESTQKLSTHANGSVVADLVFSGGGQALQTSNAPIADSALSSIGGPASTRQGIGSNSVMINVRGEMAANVDLTDVRKQLMTMGLFPPDLYGVGESFEEKRQREKLADSDPPVEELAQRLRSWDAAMTRLKTDGLLAELPTKRLLMQYTQGFVDRADPPGNLQALFDDLASHFQISRNANQVGTILVNLLHTDHAFGLAANSLNLLRGNQDTLLAKMAQIEVADGMSEAEAGYNRRLTAAKLQGRSIEEAEKVQTRNMLNEVKKRVQSISEAQATISKSRSRIATAEQELAEIRRRDCNDRALKYKADGLPYSAQIQEAHRYDWTRRYTAAMSADEDSEEALEAKYLEITSVCGDFLEVAKHLATTIIDEQKFDVVDKTVRPVIETDCHGRSVEGNRGHAGKRYKYEAFNIRLKVCTDDHGLFNGDDECAAKGYGGREVLGSLEYMKQHQPGLNIPLTCAVDYHGFRVLAVAKVPIITPVFTSSGKLRKAREDMVHGTADSGDTIRNENRVLNSKLQTVAEKLNLSSHMVKGVRELNSTALWATADLRGYKTSKNTFYLLKFWRAFPPEDPMATPHLQSSARGQSILWRGLRPELVRSNPVPLSPDANILVTHDAPDWRRQRDDVLEATRRLVNEVIPRFAEELCQRDLGRIDGTSGYSFSLTADMHRRGIGVRHLGLLRDMFWRPLQGNVDVSFNSNRVRTKTDMRLQLRRGDQVRIDGCVFTVNVKAKHEFSASFITLDRKVEMMSRNNIPIFKGKVSSDKNCAEIRRLLLAEMAARATKNMLRQLLRTSAAKSHTTAHQTQVLLTVESMNIISGSHQRSEYFWHERLLPSIRSRFGELSVDHAEEGNLRLLLQPCIVYIIQRLQEMLGFTMSAGCSNHFCNRPCGFKFTTLDISNAPMRVKHNAPMKDVADATVLVLRANKARATDYVQLVQMAQPELYLTLQERKGSRVAVNHGLGGIAISGYFIGPIKFERPGPIANDPLNRAVQLQPATQCHIDTKNTGKLLAPMQSHLPFSIEVWAKCEGGVDTTRYVLMTGRYSLLATRENCWAASVCTEDGSELSVVGPKVAHGEWVYLVVTYDGVIVRMFVNAELVIQIELHDALEHSRLEKRAEQDKALAVIQEEENRARERCKAATDRELDAYCKSREGEVKLSRAANKLREKATFALQMDRDASKKGVVKMSKADAKAQARLDIKTEMYMRNVQKVAQIYKRKRDDLQDLAAQEREEICERAEKPLRVGAMCRCKRSKTGRNFFSGDLCHVAVYLSVLPVDTVRAHHLAGVQATAAESDRLYALAGAKFQAALAFAPDDIEIISRYASSIVNYLELESVQLRKIHVRPPNVGFRKERCCILVHPRSKNPRRSQRKVEEAVELFVRMENWDGLAVIFVQLPSAPLYAGSFCQAFLATVDAVPDYYSSSLHMPLKNLAHMPKKFYLDLAGADETMIEVAASVYRLVLADLSLADIFGQVDLSWLPMIKSAPTVVAVVLQAESDDDERIVDLEKYHLDCSDVQEIDIMALINNRRLAVVLNLTGCKWVTDTSMEHVAKVLVHLQAFTISGCQSVSDNFTLDSTYLIPGQPTLPLGHSGETSRSLSFHRNSRPCHRAPCLRGRRREGLLGPRKPPPPPGPLPRLTQQGEPAGSQQPPVPPGHPTALPSQGGLGGDPPPLLPRQQQPHPHHHQQGLPLPQQPARYSQAPVQHHGYHLHDAYGRPCYFEGSARPFTQPAYGNGSPQLYLGVAAPRRYAVPPAAHVNPGSAYPIALPAYRHAPPQPYPGAAAAHMCAAPPTASATTLGENPRLHALQPADLAALSTTSWRLPPGEDTFARQIQQSGSAFRRRLPRRKDGARQRPRRRAHRGDGTRKRPRREDDTPATGGPDVDAARPTADDRPSDIVVRLGR
eukprot:g10537.t2